MELTKKYISQLHLLQDIYKNGNSVFSLFDFLFIYRVVDFNTDFIKKDLKLKELGM